MNLEATGMHAPQGMLPMQHDRGLAKRLAYSDGDFTLLWQACKQKIRRYTIGIHLELTQCSPDNSSTAQQTMQALPCMYPERWVLSAENLSEGAMSWGWSLPTHHLDCGSGGRLLV